MARYENILEAVGKTPLVRLNRLVSPSIKCPVYVKCEFMNPGGSVKDRIGVFMIDQAEQQGKLKPGATVIEATSGNTGFGLALVAAARGYKMICVMTDKQSREKIDMLKAVGAEVVICPGNAAPDDPQSTYSVAEKLAREISGAFHPNQYVNPANPLAHYKTTGPEIWEDAAGKITHFVCGMGTGGTISGISRFLKQKNPKIQVVGVDPAGSIYTEYFKTRKIGCASPYAVEGIGEDMIPETVDFSLIDRVMQVSDKDCFITARRLATVEGIFAGGSSGGAVWAALEVAAGLSGRDFVVALLPDAGSRYLSKIYNDAWMKENHYLE